MGEPETNDKGFREILIVVCGLLLLSVVATIILPLIPHNEVHPPRVNIWREYPPTIYNYDIVHVKYLGGTDDAFVGNFTVNWTDMGSNITSTGFYQKPPVYYDVVQVLVSKENITCVDAKAWDKAVRVYRPIGYNCT